MIKITILISVLLLQAQTPHYPNPSQLPQEESGECENKTNDVHQCQCKGMQDGPAYDEDGNLLPTACTHRCKKNACCCPRPKSKT